MYLQSPIDSRDSDAAVVILGPETPQGRADPQVPLWRPLTFDILSAIVYQSFHSINPKRERKG
jgi:hypothetical protein